MEEIKGTITPVQTIIGKIDVTSIGGQEGNGLKQLMRKFTLIDISENEVRL